MDCNHVKIIIFFKIEGTSYQEILWYPFKVSAVLLYMWTGVNILPKEQIFSPMLPSCDHKVSPFLPQFCDYMRGSVATKPLTAWGPGARLRAPGGGPGGNAPGSSRVLVNLISWETVSRGLFLRLNYCCIIELYP